MQSAGSWQGSQLGDCEQSILLENLHLKFKLPVTDYFEPIIIYCNKYHYSSVLIYTVKSLRSHMCRPYRGFFWVSSGYIILTNWSTPWTLSCEFPKWSIWNSYAGTDSVCGVMIATPSIQSNFVISMQTISGQRLGHHDRVLGRLRSGKFEILNLKFLYCIKWLISF